ncbi:MAG TPA: glycosyltransferase family 39 protein [Anaerolineales bacterium]|nr:glycosyltransferase family 39 protein [Anaerolineales bacterium]
MDVKFKSFIAPNRWALAFVLALLFGLGWGIRLIDLTDLPLDFHPTRQLFSAIKARGIYYQTAPDIPEWQRDIALRTYEAEATIEPPVIDTLVAKSYEVFGEHLWIARIYSSVFWMIGGLFFFLLARELLSLDEALLSLIVYLLLPYGVIASRSFQPDPLMVMLIVIGWWGALRWSKQPNWIWVILAGLAGGFAIFIKLTAIFFIAGGYIGAVLARYSLKEALRMVQLWVMALLTILPGAAYTLYGLFIAGYLGSQFGGRFFPELWIDPFFYLKWESKAALILGHLGLALALLGLLFLRLRVERIFVIALWVSYATYGMFFGHHISSHDYYSLPLVPIAAISLGVLGGVVLRGLVEQAGASAWMRSFVRLMMLFIVVMRFWQIRIDMLSVDYRPQGEYWASVGDTVGHIPSVVALTQDYGYPLVYWGWQRATVWPEYRSGVFAGNLSGFEKRFNTLTEGQLYFLVTDFNQLDLQPELEEYLYVNYPISIEGEGYVLFDLTQRSE